MTTYNDMARACVFALVVCASGVPLLGQETLADAGYRWKQVSPSPILGFSAPRTEYVIQQVFRQFTCDVGRFYEDFRDRKFRFGILSDWTARGAQDAMNRGFQIFDDDMHQVPARIEHAPAQVQEWVAANSTK